MDKINIKKMINYLTIALIVITVMLFLGFNLQPNTIFAEKGGSSSSGSNSDNGKGNKDKENNGKGNEDKENNGKGNKDKENNGKGNKDKENNGKGNEDKENNGNSNEKTKDIGENKGIGNQNKDSAINSLKKIQNANVKENVINSNGNSKAKIFQMKMEKNNQLDKSDRLIKHEQLYFNSLEKLLDIIKINNLNQASDLESIMEKNEIIDIIDVNKLINEYNPVEIETNSTTAKKIFSGNYGFIWNRIKEFAYYYNS